MRFFFKGNESKEWVGLDNISNYLKNHVHGDDIIITLGAGTVTEIKDLLVEHKED